MASTQNQLGKSRRSAEIARWDVKQR